MAKTNVMGGGMSRSYFDVQPDSPLEVFVAEAPRQRVFRLLP